MPEVKFNKDELVPPTFVDQQFIVDMVRGVEEDPELKLLSHEIKPGSSAGDHYASVMFKIIVTYETRGRTVTDRRFILKTLPDAGEKKEFLEEFPVFANEIHMYTKILPAMEKLLTKHDDKKFWPSMVYSRAEPPVLVFEDLTQNNFEMVYEMLSFADLQLILERIAKFHALSMVMAESDESCLVTKQSGFFTADQLRPIFTSTIQESKRFGQAIQKWPGMQGIGEKIEKSADKLFINYAESYRWKSASSYQVLNHGDFYIRNMMFQRDDKGTLKDVTFLDYQIPLYGSPGYDLIYMFNMIGGREVRERKFEVLKKYHTILVENLNKFGFKGTLPSAIDVHVAVLQLAAFDVFQAIGLLPMFNVDLRGVEMGELFNTSGESPIVVSLKKLYEDPEFINEMTRLLTYFDSVGVLDS